MTDEQDPFHDVAQPPSFAPIAFVAALLAALVGAAAWAAISYFADYEIGYVAWAIGGLVGIAAAAGGGRGVPMAVMAAILALMSIFCGKLAASHFGLESVLEDAAPRSLYDEFVQDASDFSALPTDVDDEQVAEFMVGHGYTEATDAVALSEQELTDFRQDTIPYLKEFHSAPPAFDAWAEERSAESRRTVLNILYDDPDIGLVDMVISELEGVDLIFALLGVATAFVLVMRASA